MVDRLVNSEINTKRIANVENCFGMSGVPLEVPGRVLVGEGVLTKICRKKPKSRQFFLFNDILVYGTILINKKKYAQQHIIPLEGLVIEDLSDEGVMKNDWLIKTSSKSFAVYAGSSSEKAEWIRHIKKCANDLLLQTGRTAPLPEQHAAVWIPDSIARVCMHCNTTQFTMINRRHHCRKCGSVICGNCSKNRVVILHQSNHTVRVCDTCYDKFYNHLKTKKLSSFTIHSSSKSPSSTAKTEQKQRLISDAAEITEVMKTCIDDTINKDSRVEEWVCLASEQMKEQLNVTEKDTVNDEQKIIDEQVDKTVDTNVVNNHQASEQVNENGSNLIDSYHNNQTSESEDDHIELTSIVVDLLDEEQLKPTFYDEQLNRDLSITDETNEKDDLQTSNPQEQIIQTDQTIETEEIYNKLSSISVENATTLNAEVHKSDTIKNVQKDSKQNDEKILDNIKSDQSSNCEIRDAQSEEINEQQKNVINLAS